MPNTALKSGPFTPVGPRVIKQDLVTQLLHAIFAGRFVGSDRLVENDLAAEFQVSRTPVREALNQLAATGLIEMQPNRGAVVRPFGPQQLRDIYTLRQILESHAVRLAQANISQNALASVREQTATLSRQRKRDDTWSQLAMQVDEKLHELIAGACGNDRLNEEITRYRKLVRVIRQTIANREGYQIQALKEHLIILDALLEDTPDAAANAMSQHIEKAADAAVDFVFSASRIKR